MPRRKIVKYKSRRGRYVSKYRRYRRRPYYRFLKRRMYKIAKQLNVEYKEHNVQYTENGVSTTMTKQNMCVIDQGTGDGQRVGRQIKITRLNMKATLTFNASATNTKFRMIILIDKQTNEGTFATTDLLYDTSVDDIIVSGLNLDKKNRFKILYDKMFSVFPEKPIVGIKYNKNFNLPILYDASTSAVGDQTRNSLWICFVSSEATNTPSFTMHARVRYVDN